MIKKINEFDLQTGKSHFIELQQYGKIRYIKILRKNCDAMIKINQQTFRNKFFLIGCVPNFAFEILTLFPKFDWYVFNMH